MKQTKMTTSKESSRLSFINKTKIDNNNISTELAENCIRQDLKNILEKSYLDPNIDIGACFDNISSDALIYFCNQYSSIYNDYDLSSDAEISAHISKIINLLENKIKNTSQKPKNLFNKFGYFVALSLVLSLSNNMLKNSELVKLINPTQSIDKYYSQLNPKDFKSFILINNDLIKSITPVDDVGVIKDISPRLEALAKIETVAQNDIFSNNPILTDNLIKIASARYPFAANFKIIKISQNNNYDYYLVGQRIKDGDTFDIGLNSNKPKIKYFQWNYFCEEPDKIPKLKFQVLYPNYK